MARRPTGRNGVSTASQKAPEVGDRALNFFGDTPGGRKSIYEVAAQHGLTDGTARNTSGGP